MLVIKLVHIGEANADGIRTVSFEFNGLPREIDIKDRNVKATNISRKKADKAIRVRSALLYQVPLLKYWWKMTSSN